MTPIRTRRRAIVRAVSIFFAFVLVVLLLYNADPRDPGAPESPRTVYRDGAHVELVATVPRLSASYLAGDALYATEDHYVYRQDPSISGRVRFDELGRLPKVDPTAGERVRDFVARLRLTRDLRANPGPNTLVVLKSGTILVFYDHIFRSTDGGETFRSIFDFEAEGIRRPFSLGVAVDGNDDVYFGEYVNSPRPHPVRILRGTKDGLEWRVFHEFPSGEIQHVHAVKYDAYRNRLWVCTGDRDDESLLMYIDERRNGLSLLGGGDQGWRIVSLIPTEEHLYWCSDDDRTGSNVYRYDFQEGERELLSFIGKPSYYATRLKDGTLVFSTTFENRTPYTIQSGEKPTTDLWISRDGSDWRKVVSLMGKPEKSGWGRRRPQIILPGGGPESEYLFATPMYTVEDDFSVQVYRIRWD